MCKYANVQMCEWVNVQIGKCTNGQMGKNENVKMCNYCEVQIIAELVYAADEPADRSKYPTGMSDSEMTRSTADSRNKC